MNLSNDLTVRMDIFNKIMALWQKARIAYKRFLIFVRDFCVLSSFVLSLKKKNYVNKNLHLDELSFPSFFFFAFLV